MNYAEMIKAARPLDDSDWGSERQVASQNALFERLESDFPDSFGADSNFEQWALKATTDEMLDRAAEIIDRHRIESIWRKVYGQPETVGLSGGPQDWAFYHALLKDAGAVATS